MKKFFLILISITIGILLLVAFLLAFEKPAEDFPVGIFEPQHTIEKEFTACYAETGDIATDTAYLIVDLSDSTNYPHEETNAVQIIGWRFQGDMSGNHEWHAHLGVVVENDATDGTAEFFACKQLEQLTGIFETSIQWAAPLDTWVEDESLLFAATNMTNTGTTWQNDVAISATVGTTSTIAAGDIVLFMDEIADGTTVDFSMCIEYYTR